LKHGKFIETLPTIGADFQTVIIGTITMRAWEPGGRERFRPLTQTYYRTAKAFIFVVDSNDPHRINGACEELHRMRNEGEFKDKPVLILANKQDLPGAMPLDELQGKLDLDKFDENVIWHLQAASALQNKGIKEGFEWLANRFVTQTDIMKPIIETFNDSVMMKNDFLSVFNLNNWKKLFNKFIHF
jgi:GTPase SAR1 family protein